MKDLYIVKSIENNDVLIENIQNKDSFIVHDPAFKFFSESILEMENITNNPIYFNFEWIDKQNNKFKYGNIDED